METTIHAFTEPGPVFPAFINVRDMGNDRFILTARARGTNIHTKVEMTRDQIEALAADIFNHFNRAY